MFKKLRYLFVFIVFVICLPMYSVEDRFDEKHTKNTTTTLKIVGKAISVELDRITQQIKNKDIDNKDINLEFVEELIKEEFSSIKTKIAHVVTHDLTKEQYDFVINILERCVSLFDTTVDDLKLMAQAILPHKGCKTFKEAFEKYCPKALTDNIHNQSNTFRMRVQLFKKLAKVDLRDIAFNNIKNFICKCGCLEDMCLMATVDLNDDKQALIVQWCCNYIVMVMAVPFAVFSGFTSPCSVCCDLKYEFERVGKIFLIMNTICGELLEAIKN